MMNILESILQALESVRANKLRSGLTLLSISIGIFAIIGAGTAVNSLDNSVNTQLAAMGENTFSVKRTPSIQLGNTWRKYRMRKDITYAQAKDFKNRMQLSDQICISNASGGFTVKCGNLSTDPDVSLIGTDENYFSVRNVALSLGRSFTAEEISSASAVAIVGNDLIVKLFPYSSGLGEMITIRNQQFLIIGVLQPQGSMLGQSLDNQVMIPISNFMRYYTNEWDASVDIAVRASSREAFMPAMDEAIGILRSLRNVKPWEDNSFEIETNESLSNQFAGFSKYLSLFGFGSGLISLLAAGVGIMNIMLVSVKERTKEIGVRKALGARRSLILFQFIVEAITLCQLGGLIGIGMGVLGGFGLAQLINTPASLPVFWVVLSVSACTAMGLLFGGYPAWKAAKLDPIEALRYE
jgi:putative ABC transport system permease protein